jgi:peptide/nickel transport system substrate-binding protein
MKAIRIMMAAAALALGAGSTAFAARTDLTIGMVLEPPHLDPTAGAAAAIGEVTYDNVFQGLTRIDRDGKVQPSLADSWTISDDGTVYTFKLHPGVKFQDGTAFSASDVKYTLDRDRGPGSVNSQKELFAHIKSVDIIDPTTVKITLDHPQGGFLYNMGRGEAVVVSPKSEPTNKEKPVGTGPFKFDHWAKGSEITLVKNPDYWGTPPSLDKVTFRFIPDAAAQTAALLAGDVQAFPNVAPDSLAQIKSDPRLKISVGTTEGETILAINNAKPPFDNLKVRQAISYALDRKEIIDGAQDGYGTPIGSHFSPADPGYVDLTGVYPHDPAKARELLKEAGFPNGFKATLKLPPTPYARDGGQIVAAQLRKVGIDLQIIPVEWAQWLDQVFTKTDYDLTIVSHVEPNDIGIYARDKYYFNYHSPKFNAVYAEYDKTADPTKRLELVGQLQKILADDAVNGFLFELPAIGVWDAKLQGMWTNLPIFAIDLRDVKWTD